MAHCEVYARVVRPLCLPAGYPLQPGQSIDADEMASLGEERLAELIESGTIELRSRRRVGATGLIDISRLQDAIECEQRELEAFAGGLAKAAGASMAGTTRVAAPPPPKAGAQTGASSEVLDALTRALCAIAEAHNDLRREFDALAARLSEGDVRG